MVARRNMMMGVGAMAATLATSAADPQVVYLATRGSGVYRSNDSGSTWGSVTGDLEGGSILDFLVASTQRRIPAHHVAQSLPGITRSPSSPEGMKNEDRRRRLQAHRDQHPELVA